MTELLPRHLHQVEGGVEEEDLEVVDEGPEEAALVMLHNNQSIKRET